MIKNRNTNWDEGEIGKDEGLHNCHKIKKSLCAFVASENKEEGGNEKDEGGIGKDEG